MELTVHPSATVVLGEAVLPGRVAYGEHHDYTLYCARLTARSFDGELLFCDNLKLMPDRVPPQSAGRFGRFSVLATMIAVTRATSGGTLADRLHARVSAMPGVLAGASELPNKSGAWLRILGVHSADVRAALDAAWNETRLALHGVAAPPRYKT